MSITFKLVNVNQILFWFFLWIGKVPVYGGWCGLRSSEGFWFSCSLPAYPDSLIILGNILLTWHSDGLRSRGLNWRRLWSELARFVSSFLNTHCWTSYLPPVFFLLFLICFIFCSFILIFKIFHFDGHVMDGVWASFSAN